MWDFSGMSSSDLRGVGLSEGKGHDGVCGGCLSSVEVTVEKSTCYHQF